MTNEGNMFIENLLHVESYTTNTKFYALCIIVFIQTLIVLYQIIVFISIMP